MRTVLIVLSLFLSGLVSAEGGKQPQPDPALVEQVKKDVEKLQKTGELSPLLKSAVEGFQKEYKDSFAKVQSQIDLETGEGLTESKIIKHIKEKEGVAIGKVSSSLPDIKDPEIVAAAKSDYEAGHKELYNIMTEKKEVKKCVTPNREVFEISNEEATKAQADVLFIESEEAAKLEAKNFGVNTTIIKVSGDPKNGAAYFAPSIPTDCFPYRVRIVGNKFIRETGELALKNYEKEPLAESEVK